MDGSPDRAGWASALTDAPVRPRARRALPVVLLALAGLALATAIAAVLESAIVGIADASPVYLLAVVLVGMRAGTGPAIATAVAAFLVYDVLFTEPRLSVVVSDPREWLDLLLFLSIALVIGRLVALSQERTAEAEAAAVEARTLYAISRALATAPDTAEAAADIVGRLREATRSERIWIVGEEGRPDGSAAAAEALLADSGEGPLPDGSVVTSLQRMPGDEPARWVRTHDATRRASTGSGASDRYRVALEIDGRRLGALWADRARALGLPDRSETRILALAADQIALALRRDGLRRAAMDLEAARHSEALKTALVDAVSHDLRTPLASIRATAGGLADPAVIWDDAARREAAASIDVEAQRLDRLVRGVLELSRIASGSVHPELEVHDLASLVETALERSRPSLGVRPLTVDLGEATVVVDPVLLDIVLTNLLENVTTHAPAPAALRVAIQEPFDDLVTLTVEDGGPGIPPDELATIFDRFQRGSTASRRHRSGLGIGLSVVRGLVEAMGGDVLADRSPLGGLRIRLRVQASLPAPAPKPET
jgi:two-component system, OmpR family, sensor histidine kinase KdpD